MGEGHRNFEPRLSDEHGTSDDISLSSNYHTNWRILSLDRFKLHRAPLHGGSSVAQGQGSDRIKCPIKSNNLLEVVSVPDYEVVDLKPSPCLQGGVTHPNTHSRYIRQPSQSLCFEPVVPFQYLFAAALQYDRVRSFTENNSPKLFTVDKVAMLPWPGHSPSLLTIKYFGSIIGKQHIQYAPLTSTPDEL
ncbi:hypothetical protein TNCV_2014411 [Trichonephila clavipes]|nr:hypothetical protein TNCV_2014411 [Trichonephila clavipes]